MAKTFEVVVSIKRQSRCSYRIESGTDGCWEYASTQERALHVASALLASELFAATCKAWREGGVEEAEIDSCVEAHDKIVELTKGG